MGKMDLIVLFHLMGVLSSQLQNKYIFGMLNKIMISYILFSFINILIVIVWKVPSIQIQRFILMSAADSADSRPGVRFELMYLWTARQVVRYIHIPHCPLLTLVWSAGVTWHIFVVCLYYYRSTLVGLGFFIIIEWLEFRSICYMFVYSVRILVFWRNILSLNTVLGTRKW